MLSFLKVLDLILFNAVYPKIVFHWRSLWKLEVPIFDFAPLVRLLVKAGRHLNDWIWLWIGMSDRISSGRSNEARTSLTCTKVTCLSEFPLAWQIRQEPFRLALSHMSDKMSSSRSKRKEPSDQFQSSKLDGASGWSTEVATLLTGSMQKQIDFDVLNKIKVKSYTIIYGSQNKWKQLLTCIKMF